jgi:hypothetical protein
MTCTCNVTFSTHLGFTVLPNSGIGAGLPTSAMIRHPFVMSAAPSIGVALATRLGEVGLDAAQLNAWLSRAQELCVVSPAPQRAHFVCMGTTDEMQGMLC